LKVHFGAPETAKSRFGFRHEKATESLTLPIRVDREVVDPAAVALVTNHHCSDQLAVVFEYEKVLGISSRLTVYVAVRVVLRLDEVARGPKCDESFAVF